jgi:calcineurin-like phosphoesterase family protein
MKSIIFKNFNEVTEQKDILKILSDIKTEYIKTQSLI